ncbi:MAG: pyridoxamine 5'-phosphate oxidase family protein [Gemmatimonadales bacterium]
MPDVSSFDDIRDEFERRVRKTVWAQVATVDTAGRPRNRILHPLWEGTTGWIATVPQTLKAKHLARNNHVSLGYIDAMEPVYVEATAAWVDSVDEKRRVWEYIKSFPEPYGYDPGAIGVWDSPEGENFGLLKLTPSRIEVSAAGGEGKVWRAT